MLAALSPRDGLHRCSWSKPPPARAVVRSGAEGDDSPAPRTERDPTGTRSQDRLQGCVVNFPSVSFFCLLLTPSPCSPRFSFSFLVLRSSFFVLRSSFSYLVLLSRSRFSFSFLVVLLTLAALVAIAAIAVPIMQTRRGVRSITGQR